MTFVNISEAANHFGIKVCALRKLVRDGRIPYTVIAGRYMFCIPLLEDFFKQQMVDNVARSCDHNDHYTE